MSDWVAVTPGSGANVAADLISGTHHQRVKVQHGADGSAVDTSAANPLPVQVLGELIEAVQALRTICHSLDMSIGRVFPDAAGRVRVTAAAADFNVSTVSTVTAVTTVSAVTNQTQVGGINAAPQIPALMQIGVESLRRNISTS